MSDVLDDLGVAGGGLTVVGGGGQGGGGGKPGPLLPHALHLALLRLRKLRGYHDQAEVYHEEGADLNNRKTQEIYSNISHFNLYLF